MRPILRVPWLLCLCVAIVLLSGCTSVNDSTTTVTVVPGRLHGEIRFSDASAAVLAQVAAHPVAEWSGSIFLQDLTQGTFAGSSSYSLTTTAGVLATYDATTNVLSSGTSTFLVRVDPLRFVDGSEYRFGSYQSSSSAAHTCGPVLPLTESAEGAVCDIVECAVGYNVRPHTSGDSADLNALSGNAQCRVQALVGEPGALPTNLQAQSAYVSIPVADLEADRAIIPVIVRGGVPVQFNVSCSANVTQSGFAVVPGTTQTPLSGSSSILTPAVCSAGSPATDVAVDLPVRRSAGHLQGLFDISDHTESSGQVSILTLGGYNTAPPLPPAGSEPNPSQPWRFEGVPPGEHRLQAAALFDNGNSRITTPQLGGPNGMVPVTTGQTTDVGRTFVAKPQPLTGSIVLRDPPGLTALRFLNTAPFGSLYDTNTTFIEAEGSQEQAAGGASGDQGRSASILSGTYNSVGAQANMSFQLLLTGLSTTGVAPSYSPLDGSTGQDTPWNVRSLQLHITDPNGSNQFSRIQLLTDLHRTYHVNQPIESLPPQDICFGEIKLTITSSTSLPEGSGFHDPYLFVYGTPPAQPLPGGSQSPYQLNFANSFGRPQLSTGPTASVDATLPSGIRYTMKPSVRLTIGTSDSLISLPAVTVPDSGYLGCGAITQLCAATDPSGNTQYTYIALTPEPPRCTSDPHVEFDVHVSSGGAEVSALSVQVDSATPMTLCSPCGADPTRHASLTLSNGTDHTIRVSAQTANADCPPPLTRAVNVPGAPSMTCPAPFTVYVPPGSATTISASDPQIVEEFARVTATGGCTTPQVSHTPTGPYAVGTHTITFNSSDGQACERVMTVKQTNHHLAFVDQGNVKVYRVDDAGLQWERPTTTANPRGLEYDLPGLRLGVIEENAIRVLQPNDGSEITTLAGDYSAMAFRPQHGDQLAAIAAPIPPSGSYRLILHSQQYGTLGAATLDPSLPAGATMRTPRLTWTPDGASIHVAFTVESTSLAELRMQQWNISNDALGATPQRAVAFPSIQGMNVNPALREKVLAVVAYWRTRTLFEPWIITTSRSFMVGDDGLPRAVHFVRTESARAEANLPVAAVNWSYGEYQVSILTEGVISGLPIGDSVAASSIDLHRLAYVGAYRVQLFDVPVTATPSVWLEVASIPTTAARVRFPIFRPVRDPTQ